MKDRELGPPMHAAVLRERLDHIDKQLAHLIARVDAIVVFQVEEGEGIAYRASPAQESSNGKG